MNNKNRTSKRKTNNTNIQPSTSKKPFSFSKPSFELPSLGKIEPAAFSKPAFELPPFGKIEPVAFGKPAFSQPFSSFAKPATQPFSSPPVSFGKPAFSQQGSNPYLAGIPSFSSKETPIYSFGKQEPEAFGKPLRSSNFKNTKNVTLKANVKTNTKVNLANSGYNNGERFSVKTREKIPSCLISFDRGMVQLTATIKTHDKTILQVRHIVSSDLKDSITSYLQRVRDVDFTHSQRIASRIAAMAPKVSADISGPWQIGEFIRRNLCVLERQSSTSTESTDKRFFAGILANYDTDTETCLCSDTTVCNSIPSTNYYTANTYLFITSEIMHLFMRAAFTTSMKNKVLQEALKNLDILYKQDLPYDETIATIRTIEQEFDKIGTFSFEYTYKDTHFYFTKDSTRHPIFSDDNQRKRRAYTEILRSLTDDTSIIEWANEKYKEPSSMNGMFVTFASMFKKMFGMDEQFFQIHHGRVIDSLARKNHDELKDPRIIKICLSDDKPIRTMSIFKVFRPPDSSGKKFSFIAWVPLENSRLLLEKTSSICSSIAWGRFPESITKNYGKEMPLSVLKGVYKCFPSVKTYQEKQVLGSSYDSQKSTIVIQSDRPFFYTPPISNYQLSFTVNISSSTTIACNLLYIGRSLLRVNQDDEPFKTVGIAYVKNGETVTIEGNTTDGTLYKSIATLLSEYHKNDGSCYIPKAVFVFIRIVFRVSSNSESSNSESIIPPIPSMIEAKFKEFISYHEKEDGTKYICSLTSMLTIMDNLLKGIIRAREYQDKISRYKASISPVCR